MTAFELFGASPGLEEETLPGPTPEIERQLQLDHDAFTATRPDFVRAALGIIGPEPAMMSRCGLHLQRSLRAIETVSERPRLSPVQHRDALRALERALGVLNTAISKVSDFDRLIATYAILGDKFDDQELQRRIAAAKSTAGQQADDIKIEGGRIKPEVLEAAEQACDLLAAWSSRPASITEGGALFALTEALALEAGCPLATNVERACRRVVRERKSRPDPLMVWGAREEGSRTPG